MYKTISNAGKLTVLVGGQYGSEGKGAVAAHVANDYQVHVRVGSPNAGHTIYWNGEKQTVQRRWAKALYIKPETNHDGEKGDETPCCMKSTC